MSPTSARPRAAAQAVTVRGPGAEMLGPLARAWAEAVAGFLGRPVPGDAVVQVHAAAGVSGVRDGRLHLYHKPGGPGAPDTAQLPHELVHLIAGVSPSRLLTEGLAVHVADRLRLGPPCWPTYRASPEVWVARMHADGSLPALAELAELAASLSVTRDAGDPAAAGQAWQVYVAAGSFVGYLWRTRPAPRFWSAYAAGRAWDDPEQRDAVERAWLAQLPAKLDPAAAQAVASSLQDARRELRAARADR